MFCLAPRVKKPKPLPNACGLPWPPRISPIMTTAENRITISIGVTQYCHEEPISSFVQRADQAMYQSKQNGRNKVSCIFANPAT